MDAICERCGARVTGAACDLCGGTRLLSAPASAPVPAPMPHITAAPAPAPTPSPTGGEVAAETRAAESSPPVDSSGGPTATPPPVGGPPPSPRSVSPGGWLGNRKVLAIAGSVLLIAVIASVPIVMSRRGSANETTASSTPVVTAFATTADHPSVSSDHGPAPAIQCWNNKMVATIEDCSMPSGTAGLRYVYPSYDNGRSCVYKAYRKTTSTFDCDVKKGVLRFRWWSDTDEAAGHYTAKYRNGSTTALTLDGQQVGTLYRDRKPVKRVYRLSGFLWDHFSFSVEAKSQAKVDALLKQIEIRHPDDITGYHSETGPRGTVGVHW